MNNNQRKLLIGVGIVFIGMLLFPPFVNTAGWNVGYSFILKPSSYYDAVNIPMLMVQWIAVVAAGAIGWFILKDKKPPTPPPPGDTLGRQQ